MSNSVPNWRDQILQEFTPRVARLTLVADPDGLLLEEGVLAAIRERGFELLPCDDHIACRYAYESRFRCRWDQGEETDLVVVLHTATPDLAALPYDLLQAGRQLSFNLGDIFPHLSYPVLAALDRRIFDALYEALQRHAPGPLGDNASKDFVLRHVFGLVPERLATPADLLRTLLQWHYRGESLPELLQDRFLHLLQVNSALANWPLKVLMSDRDAFLLFLQERWPWFLDRFLNPAAASAGEDKSWVFAIPGPAELPFDHPDIRVYLDTLFLEGLLQPVDQPQSVNQAPAWLRSGIRFDPVADHLRRLTKLLDHLQLTVPGEEAGYKDWLHFARRWAELWLLAHSPPEALGEALVSRLNRLQNQVDRVFFAWLSHCYARLISLPPLPPVLLHQVPRFLTRQLEEQRQQKVALLVVDGLAWEQWLVVREEISRQRPHIWWREQAVFAWLPTLTPVSRQALFAGRPPFYFPQSIWTTDKEPDLWQRFWQDQGLAKDQVIYRRGVEAGNLEELEELIDQLGRPHVRVAGLVLAKVDKIMHGMTLGAAGMLNQVRQWARQPDLANLFDLLLTCGFAIFLTSDHGNIEARGCGRPGEGAVADLRGERVRVFPEERLRRQVQQQFPEAHFWPPFGLPEDYLPLLAPGRAAFVRVGETIVCHGGPTIEELIVPLVQISGRQP